MEGGRNNREAKQRRSPMVTKPSQYTAPPLRPLFFTSPVQPVQPFAWVFFSNAHNLERDAKNKVVEAKTQSSANNANNLARSKWRENIRRKVWRRTRKNQRCSPNADEAKREKHATFTDPHETLKKGRQNRPWNRRRSPNLVRINVKK